MTLALLDRAWRKAKELEYEAAESFAWFASYMHEIRAASGLRRREFQELRRAYLRARERRQRLLTAARAAFFRAHPELARVEARP